MLRLNSVMQVYILEISVQSSVGVEFESQLNTALKRFLLLLCQLRDINKQRTGNGLA